MAGRALIERPRAPSPPVRDLVAGRREAEVDPWSSGATPFAARPPAPLGTDSARPSACACGAPSATGGPCAGCRRVLAAATGMAHTETSAHTARDVHERQADELGRHLAEPLQRAGAVHAGPLAVEARQLVQQELGVDAVGTTLSESDGVPSAGPTDPAPPLAVARERHIQFAPGQLRPGSGSAAYLMGHELVHVAQQVGGRGPLAQTAGMPAVLAAPPGRAQARETPQVHERFLKALIDAKRNADPQLGRANEIARSLSAEDAEILYNRLTSGSRRDQLVVYFNSDANVAPDAREGLLGALRSRFGSTAGQAAPASPASPASEASAQAGSPGQAPEGSSGLVRWPAAADALHGITPYYALQQVPATTFSPASAPRRGPYRIAAQLRHGAGGAPELLYFVAFRVQPGLVGPTNWEEYAIGPDSIDQFITHLDGYAAAGAGAYMFGPPSRSAVEGARFVDAALGGQPAQAVAAYKRALYEAVTDPGWWITMLTALSGLAGGAGEVPSAPVPRAPFVPRVIEGGGVAVASRPAIVGATALKLEPVPGIAARLQAVPTPAPAPPAPAVPAPALPPVGAAAVAVVASNASQSPTVGTAPTPAAAPAPSPAQNQQRPRPAGEKVADSNIFQDRPERNTRATIDLLYLSNPAVTLHVPAAAIAEVVSNDPFGTQSARLAGQPGGARILPDVDGNVAPLAPLFPKILSARFGEADLRIALRAKERVLPLLTAQAALASQVRDGNFPERVKAVGSVVVEVVP